MFDFQSKAEASSKKGLKPGPGVDGGANLKETATILIFDGKKASKSRLKSKKVLRTPGAITSETRGWLAGEM